MTDQLRFMLAQAAKYCVGFLKSLCLTDRRLTNKLLTWSLETFNTWKDSQPLSSLDYTLGATRLEKYKAKVNTGRTTIRAVNDTLFDPVES